jgi:hypothetical protein
LSEECKQLLPVPIQFEIMACICHQWARAPVWLESVLITTDRGKATFVALFAIALVALDLDASERLVRDRARSAIAEPRFVEAVELALAARTPAEIRAASGFL